MFGLLLRNHRVLLFWKLKEWLHDSKIDAVFDQFKMITVETSFLVRTFFFVVFGMLRYMHNNVPGIEVPDEIVARMKDAEDPQKEGIKIALELVDAVKKLSGAKGVHLQAIEAEGILPGIIKEAGLFPRP